ncbi:MAG: cytochrome c [Alphaproteobacteria bacterium]|nr:cytochrome c [Alphaproteobacteria bacterium]
MAKILKIVGILLGVLVLAGAGGALWMWSARDARLAIVYEVEDADFPVPFPLTDDEVAALRAELEAGRAAAVAEGSVAEGSEEDVLADVDLSALALERAVERGKHLVESRYICVECHGQDFGGGTMIDDPGVGTILGPNLTTGAGSVTADFTPADWSRAVRHGVRSDGTPLVMPADDFVAMSDLELSDVIAYIRTAAPVDKTVPRIAFGPVGTMLVATNTLPLAAEMFPDHTRSHEPLPPPTGDTVAFGQHLAGVCTGCHNPNLTGGPRPGFPPDWAEPLNLTPHASGLEGWTFEDFQRVMRQGVRKNGEPLKLPMNKLLPYSLKMTDTELHALWTYFTSLEPRPYGE